MTMRPPLEAKTPNEEKDYGVNWARYLGTGVTIVLSNWAVPAGINEVADDIDGQATLIRLSGGTAGQNYTIVNAITTSTGEDLEAAIQVRVRAAAEIAGIP